MLPDQSPQCLISQVMTRNLRNAPEVVVVCFTVLGGTARAHRTPAQKRAGFPGTNIEKGSRVAQKGIAFPLHFRFHDRTCTPAQSGTSRLHICNCCNRTIKIISGWCSTGGPGSLRRCACERPCTHSRLCCAGSRWGRSRRPGPHPAMSTCEWVETGSNSGVRQY